MFRIPLPLTFKPKFFTTLQTYTTDLFLKDLQAGIIVGIVALPLAIAFAIASGVSPEKGLITAVIAGFLISFLGGSRVQIGGPTGAFVVIVSGVVGTYGLNGLLISTFMAGVILIIMGLTRMGTYIKFIPYPIVTGFTSGIAVIIFSTQVKDFFGLSIESVPSEFIPKWISYATHLGSVNWYAPGLALFTILTILYWPRLTQKIPGSLVAVILTTLVVQVFNLPVETIESKFGAIPSSLPAPMVPQLDWQTVRNLIPPATAIALLAAIESLLSALVADGMTGSRHRSNMELIAQGVANIASPIFGGIPATGAIARTATNVKNGGRTPVAGMIHAIVLLLIMLLAGQWAGLIPMATLAGILMVVAWNMSEMHAFRSIMKGPKTDKVVLLTAFLLTVIFDLVLAIEIGMVLAAFLFMKKMADISHVSLKKQDFAEDTGETDANTIMQRSIPGSVAVFEINGPLFFGTVHKFRESISLNSDYKVLIIRMRNVPYMDTGGLRTLEDIHEQCRKSHVHLLISDIHTQPLFISESAGFLEKIGIDNVLGNLDEAINHARGILGLPPVEPPVPFEPTVERERHPPRAMTGKDPV